MENVSPGERGKGDITLKRGRFNGDSENMSTGRASTSRVGR